MNVFPYYEKTIDFTKINYAILMVKIIISSFSLSSTKMDY